MEQGLTLLAPYATGQGSVEVWLSQRSGSLVRAELSGSLTVNVGAAASALSGLLAPASGSSGSLPGGSLGVSLSLRADVSDYGGTITVTRPEATSTLPSGGMPGWLELLAGRISLTARREWPGDRRPEAAPTPRRPSSPGASIGRRRAARGGRRAAAGTPRSRRRWRCPPRGGPPGR